MQLTVYLTVNNINPLSLFNSYENNLRTHCTSSTLVSPSSFICIVYQMFYPSAKLLSDSEFDNSQLMSAWFT